MSRTKKQWIDAIYHATEIFKEKHPLEKSKKSKLKLTPKEKKIIDKFDNCNFEEYGEGIGELVNAIVGKKIIDTNHYKETKEDEDGIYNWLKPGVALIPTKCENDHDYEIGKVCIATGRDNNVCIDLRNDDGNHLGCRKSAIKYATKKQIEAFVKKIELSTLEDHLRYLKMPVKKKVARKKSTRR